MHVFGLNLKRFISIGGFVYNRQLDSFVRVVDAGSFNKAARDLYITPASLIQQVNLLEERLGVQMLTRSRRGVSLTEAGSSLYQDAVEIMRHADLAVERARLIASGDVRVRVGTSLLTRCRYLPSLCDRLEASGREASIEVVSLGSPHERGSAFLSEPGRSCDIIEGLYLSEYYRGKCSFLKLLDVALVLALPPGFAGGDALSIDDLAGGEVVMLRRGVSQSFECSFLKLLDVALVLALPPGFAGGDALSIDDLAGGEVVMLRRGVSQSFDRLRKLLEVNNEIAVKSVSFYGIDVFVDCEVNKRALVMPALWADLVPEMRLALLENAPSIPYGLVYASRPAEHIERFVSDVMDVLQSPSRG